MWITTQIPDYAHVPYVRSDVSRVFILTMRPWDNPHQSWNGENKKVSPDFLRTNPEYLLRRLWQERPKTWIILNVIIQA